MKRLLAPTTYHADLGILLLRLLFGGMFIRYGYMKIVNFEQIVPMFTDFLHIGSKLALILVIFAEFFCGIFVALGLLTRLTVIPIFITMVVAYFMAHAKDPFDVKAMAFMMLLLRVIVFVNGSGKYSIDSMLFKKSVY